MARHDGSRPLAGRHEDRDWRTVRADGDRPWDRLPSPRSLSRSGAAGRWTVLTALLVLVLFLVLPGAAQQQADFLNALAPPSEEHLFGTDHAGRDLLSRTISGARVSLLVGVVAAVTAGILGSLVGGLSGALARRGGGGIDSWLMRLVDTVNSLPHLVLGIVIVAMLRPSLNSVIISIAVTHWTTTARLVRAEVLALSTVGFVEASLGAGASRWWVLTRHQIAHVFGRVLLSVVLMVPHAVMHESALSFLGLGLQESEVSLGTIIEESRSSVLTGAWWPVVLPGLVLVGLSLVVYVIAESLRPRSRGRL